MRRDELEHALRAAGDLLGDTEVIVAGSQAILGSYSEDELPDVTTRSVEVDIVPLDDPDQAKAERLWILGPLSQFHETFEFYLDGIGEATLKVPDGWRERLVPFANDNTNGVTGFCLEPHDLAASKLAAGRAQDWEFVRALLGAGLLDDALLIRRVKETQGISRARRSEAVKWVTAQAQRRKRAQSLATSARTPRRARPGEVWVPGNMRDGKWVEGYWRKR